MSRLQTADRTKLAFGGLALAVVLFFAVNIFSNSAFQGWRLDLTEGRLFTLSKGTLNVLSDIEEPVTLRLYYSKKLGESSPRHATLFGRVRELLERYVDLSKAKVQLELYNPEPFSDAEDKAVADGLKGIPLNNAGELGYFGLAGVNSTDDQAVIPFFTTEREAFLEYDMTKVVHTLANPERKVVGVMSPLPVDGGVAMPPRTPAPPWAVMDQIREFFDVQALPTSLRQIPDDIDILLLIHPKGFDDFTLYAIDQFVLGGGRVLAFVDANAEVDVPPDGRMTSLPVSDFNKILKTWGLQLVANKVAADLDSARRVNVRVGGKLSVVDYVVWLGLSKKNFDAKDAVTGDISVINMASAGILEKTGDAKTEIQPLITTGPRAMGIGAEKIMRSPDVVGLFRDFKSENKPLTLAARIKGTIKTAFPDGPPKDKDGTSVGVPPKHLGQSARPANLIVVADVDMLYDRFWVETRNLLGQRLLVPNANNADFVVNSLDNLGGSDALIGLRGRQESSRPFQLVLDIRQGAERQFRTKEQALQTKLEDVRAKLNNLIQRRGDKSDVVLTPEDSAAIAGFRREMSKVRRDLRQVQLELRKDLDRLDGFLKFVNIALVPLLLGFATVMATLIGRARRRAKTVPQE
ncbi:MAG: Gldg family protein [Rhodospirillales bacterium]|nr:Gldg family protein [Rhodospirillales bacterium]